MQMSTNGRAARGPVTRPSLLVRLRDARDQEAWGHFVRVYGPLVYHFARRRGLQDSDSGDVMQEVLRAVMVDACRLEEIRRRGSFRSWLFTVAHHRVYDFLERRRRQTQGSGQSDIHALLREQPAACDEDAWEHEYRQHLLALAARQVQDHCSPKAWQAFQRTAVEGQSATTVAASLGMTVAAVYLAKSRIMARLKEQVRMWEEEENRGIDAMTMAS